MQCLNFTSFLVKRCAPWEDRWALKLQVIAVLKKHPPEHSQITRPIQLFWILTQTLLTTCKTRCTDASKKFLNGSQNDLSYMGFNTCVHTARVTLLYRWKGCHKGAETQGLSVTWFLSLLTGWSLLPIGRSNRPSVSCHLFLSLQPVHSCMIWAAKQQRWGKVLVCTVFREED